MQKVVPRSIKALADVRGLKPNELNPEQIHNLFTSSLVTVILYAGLITNGWDKAELRKKTAADVTSDVPPWLMQHILDDLCVRYVELFDTTALDDLLT